MSPRVFTLMLILLAIPTLAHSRVKSIMIGYKQAPDAIDRSLVLRARAVIQRSYQLIPALAVSLPEEEINELSKNSEIVYIEENAVYTAIPEILSTEEYDRAWGVSQILANRAHANGHRGTGIKVAVIDTGIDYTHADLNDNYRGGYDFVFDDEDPFDDSVDSHGTYVAGIIAAEDDGVGVVGVAPDVDLYALKVLDGAGFGLVEWIVAALDWAVENEIHVVNLSIEGPHRQALQDACDTAYNAGVLLVASGGNSLVEGGAVTYPAAYDSVIAVTATDIVNRPGYFSPMGDSLELAAPGVNVLSTIAGGGYDAISGTSIAAPHVTGAIALWLTAMTDDLNGDGLVTHEDVRRLLQWTAIDLGEVGKDDLFGYGLVNLCLPASPLGDSTGHEVTIDDRQGGE